MGATPQTTVLVSMYKTLHKLCVGPLVVPYVVHVAFRVTVSVASEQQQEHIEMLPKWCGLWANAPLISGQTWCDRKVLHYFSPLLKACHWLLHWFSTFQAAIGSSSFKESWKCRHKIALQGSSVMFSHLVVIFIWFSRDRPPPAMSSQTIERLKSYDCCVVKRRKAAKQPQPAWYLLVSHPPRVTLESHQWGINWA